MVSSSAKAYYLSKDAIQTTMKHHVIIITLFIAASCIAMEPNNKQCSIFGKPNILRELTAIKNPKHEIYLTENHAVVLNETQCNIVNTTTNTEITKLWDNLMPGYSTGIEIHPNKTKIALFYHSGTPTHYNPEIAVYDAQTYTKEWSKKTNTSSIDKMSF